MTDDFLDPPAPLRARERFDPLDPARAGTTTTTCMPGTRELVRCDHCHAIGEFRWEDLQRIWHGTGLRWCDACLTAVEDAHLHQRAA